MEFDGFANLIFDVSKCQAGGNTTWQVRDAGAVVAVCFLNDDGVFYGC
jgi:hypothetical protein